MEIYSKYPVSIHASEATRDIQTVLIEHTLASIKLILSSEEIKKMGQALIEYANNMQAIYADEDADKEEKEKREPKDNYDPFDAIWHGYVGGSNA